MSCSHASVSQNPVVPGLALANTVFPLAKIKRIALTFLLVFSLRNPNTNATSVGVLCKHACVCHRRPKHQPIFASTISTWQARRPPPAGGSADYSRQPKRLGLILISFQGCDLRVLIHPDSSSRELQVRRHWRQTDHAGIPHFRVSFMLGLQFPTRFKSFTVERELVLHPAKLYQQFQKCRVGCLPVVRDLPSVAAVTVE